MDPVTAAILIGVAVTSIGTGIYNNNKAVKARNRQRKEEEKMRVESVRNEIGVTNQRANTALGAAANRNSSNLSPSFAAAALTANQPTFNSGEGNTSSGLAGTF